MPKNAKNKIRGHFPYFIYTLLFFLKVHGRKYGKCPLIKFIYHSKTGRPLGTERFIKKLEKAFDRGLLPKKAGRPRKKRRV